MSFTFRVVFSGIQAFVPNGRLAEDAKQWPAMEDESNGSRPHVIADAVRVVIPNCLQGDYDDTRGPAHAPRPPHFNVHARPSPLDGGTLSRHMAFLQIPGPSLGVRGAGEMLTYLDRERVTFSFAGGAEGPLEIAYDPAADAYEPGDPPVGDVDELHSLTWIPDMRKISRGHATVDSRMLAAKPPSDVLGHVDLTGGRVGAWRILPQPWEIPAVLAPEVNRQRFSHEVVWEVEDVDAVWIRLRSFDTGAVRSLKLDAPAGDVLEIAVVNLCYDNPLRWAREPRFPEHDQDVRWYYSLLSQEDQAWVKGKLAKGDLLPHPVRPKGLDESRTSMLSGAGGDCMLALFESSSW